MAPVQPNKSDKKFRCDEPPSSAYPKASSTSCPFSPRVGFGASSRNFLNLTIVTPPPPNHLPSVADRQRDGYDGDDEADCTSNAHALRDETDAQSPWADSSWTPRSSSSSPLRCRRSLADELYTADGEDGDFQDAAASTAGPLVLPPVPSPPRVFAVPRRGRLLWSWSSPDDDGSSAAPETPEAWMTLLASPPTPPRDSPLAGGDGRRRAVQSPLVGLGIRAAAAPRPVGTGLFTKADFLMFLLGLLLACMWKMCLRIEV